MKKILFTVIAAVILIIPFGCSKESNPAGESGPDDNNTTFVDAGVSAELVGAWNIYKAELDSALIGMGFVFSSNDITLFGYSILSNDSKPVANNGNIGYAKSSKTAYIYEYSLSPNKDSLYIVQEATATAHPVTREAAAAGVGIYVKE